MEFLLNPNAAYVLVTVTLILCFLTLIIPRSWVLKIVTVLGIVLVGYILFQTKWDPWALVVVLLTPLAFFTTIRQTERNLLLPMLTIIMVVFGPFFLFIDANGRLANINGAVIISIVAAQFTWMAIRRSQLTHGIQLTDVPDYMVGLTGKAWIDIQPNIAGTVQVDGELWTAYSKTYIPAGSRVRILRQDGPVLTVTPVENNNRTVKARSLMAYDIHQEKNYLQDQSKVYDAAKKSVEKLKGQILKSKPEEFQFEVKFDKKLLGKVLGDRTQMTCVVQADGDGSKVVMDIYPLDAIGRKLMFGARKGVSEEVLRLFKEHLENNLT